MLNLKKTLCVAAPALVALTLSGCGLFKSSGSSDKYNPNAPSRTVARMVANVNATSVYNDPAGGNPLGFPLFNATLFDADGRQFYGPDVTLDGTKVDILKAGEDTSTFYQKKNIAYATGQTWTTTVQGHSATSPAALPALLMTSPAPPKPKNDQGYYEATPVTAGSGLAVTWSGGDPSQPVYIFVQELNTANTPYAPRLFVKEPASPTLAPNDPAYFGAPIENTGSYDIPAQITQRIVNTDGSISTQTVTTFAAPAAGSSFARSYRVYVLQKVTTPGTAPIEFSVISAAYVPVSVPVPPAK